MVGSKRRDIGLGGYPEVSLAEARELARADKLKIKAGIDPIEQRKSIRQTLKTQQATSRTFKQVAIEVYAVKQPEFTNAKHAAQWINTLETYAYPMIGTKAVADLDEEDIKEVLLPIWVVKTETATRLRQRIEKIIDYAIHKKYRQHSNPAAWKGLLENLLPKPTKVRKKAGGIKHHPRVGVAEMPRFMTDLGTRISISSIALQFAILTAGRSGEVRGATWAEIDFNATVWRVGEQRMKGEKAHKVPLSVEALKLLKGLPRGKATDLLFPGIKGKQMSDSTLSKMLKDAHAADIKAGGEGYLDPDSGRVATPHGTARSSFKDWCRKSTSRVMSDGNRSSFPDDWSELALAHVSTDETRSAYARDGLLEERKELMQAWANYLSGKIR